jgi:hypothetical protein
VSDALQTATTQTSTQIAKLRTDLTATIDANQKTLTTQLTDYNRRLTLLENPVTRLAIAGPGISTLPTR